MMKSYLFKLYREFHKLKSDCFAVYIQKRLGYEKKDKLLIVHADDLGMSDSENIASIKAMEKGIVNSGSIMVPCSKFKQIANYAYNNPQTDLGIHLTLTSEWSSYKWKPISSPGEVASIVDSNGYFYRSSDILSRNFIPTDIEKELRAQIDMAINTGIVPTHIDSHMFSVFSDQKIQDIYVSLGKEYKLPILINYEIANKNSIPKYEVLVNRIYYARPEHYNNGLDDYYRKTLMTMQPGLNIILLHIAFNNNEMCNIMGDEIAYGSEWRQHDFNFFTSEECRIIIKKQKLKLITWREIRDKLFH